MNSTPMEVRRARTVRMRLWWTTLLVLIALGGAGLAAAADRPQNPQSRPELTWRADRDAQKWIDALANQLDAIDGRVGELSLHGRDALGRITALDVERMNDALAAGDLATTNLETGITALRVLRDETLATVEEWRLGPSRRNQLELLTGAAGSVEELTDTWHGLAADARRAADLVDSLLRHDGLVFQATTAGRSANWNDALALLERAAGPLGEATEIRNVLGTGLDTDTLDDLLERYRAYDAALTALYTYIRDTGRTGGRDFDELEENLERAQAALPADTTAMTVIISEAAGPPMTHALVTIETARGAIREALDFVEPVEP